MTFKEQMQEKAWERINSLSINYDDRQFGIRCCEFGSQAALSSDLVKGLVDAGDKILEWWRQDDETGVLNADDVMDALNAALTNYKNEVNNNLCQNRN